MLLAIQRICLVVMGIKLRMISSDVNAAITPTVGVAYILLPGRGRDTVTTMDYISELDTVSLLTS